MAGCADLNIYPILQVFYNINETKWNDAIWCVSHDIRYKKQDNQTKVCNKCDNENLPDKIKHGLITQLWRFNLQLI